MPFTSSATTVSYVSYFHDGKQMINGSHDKTIRRWDLREGQEIKYAREVCDDYHIGAAVVSRDGRWVEQLERSGQGT
jgi:WD40 repeat protein